MTDAWIISDDDVPAREAARQVSELGFRPVRVVANGALVPHPDEGASGGAPAVAIVLGDLGVLARLSADEALQDVPVVLALDADQMDDLEPLVGVDELLVRPFVAAELRARIARARHQVNGIQSDDVVQVGELRLDLATYCVTIKEETVDFTYMEYELLKFLVTHPNRVFSRESLLSRVWGYDYFGGARTVDVHVRRVRAKLGLDYAERLKTVRSVGYRFEA